MADLFDFKVGGLGFHITAHMIAIAALFVACFAITVYITFRDDTVPGSALKDQDADFEDLTADSLTLANGFTRKVFKTTFPARTAAQNDDSLGPIVSGLTEAMGCYFVAGYVEQSTAQTAALGALIIKSATTARAAFDADGDGGTILTGTLVTSTANTAFKGVQYGPTNQVLLGSTDNTDICLTAGTAGAVVDGAVTAYVILEHGPGGSFPAALPNSA